MKHAHHYLLFVLAISACAEKPDDIAVVEAVATVAQRIVSYQKWCPQTINGREFTHSVWRESDVTDPALVCFYK